MNRQSLKLAVMTIAARLSLLGERRSRSIREYLLIKNSQFFDEEWYLRTNPDVAKSGVDAAWHYYENGWKEGRLPSLRFDGNDYIRRYPDVAKAKMTPLVHWEKFGRIEGRTARSVADVREEERRKAEEEERRKAEERARSKGYDAVKASELFDAEWYLKKNPDVAKSGVDAAWHYCEYGWRDGRLPSLRFDGNDYIRRYPDVAKAKMNPLVHWEKFGRIEGRTARSVADVREEERRKAEEASRPKGYEAVKASELFDAEWYLEEYPDVASAKKDPVLHYCQYGWKEGRLPSLRFDGNDYLRRYPDVAKAKMNPLVHWEEFGKKGGRKVNCKVDITEEDQVYLIRRSDLFDETWYRQEYKLDERVDAAKHYFTEGWRRKFNPSLHFDGNAYLDFYDGGAQEDMCPLPHYVRYGRGEGRFVPEVVAEPCDVLIITSAAPTDGVYVWRLVFMKEWLEANGFKVRVESIREPTSDYLSLLKAARFVIFNRAIFSKSFFDGRSVDTIRCLLAWNKGYCFDIDDLMALQYAETLGRYKSCGIEYANLQPTIFAHSNCYTLTKTMTVSTPFLGECLSRHFNLRTVVLPNTIPISRCVGKPASRTSSGKLRLLYASGSPTHLYDLSTIYLNLLNFLLRHEDATLTVLGRSTGMADFTFLDDRVNVVEYVEYDRMLQIFGEHDLLIVPLDCNETNNAKSNIKYIEAGALGTPVIAQDCMEFRSAIRDGENGFLYSSADDFEEKMESILKNREHLAAVGQAALEDVRKNHSTSKPLPTAFKEMICS